MQDEYDFSKAKRGPVLPPDPNRTRITFLLDNEILDWLRDQVDAAGGGSYQELINTALCEHMQRAILEHTLRRIIREAMNGGV